MAFRAALSKALAALAAYNREIEQESYVKGIDLRPVIL